MKGRGWRNRENGERKRERRVMEIMNSFIFLPEIDGWMDGKTRMVIF